MRRRGSQMPKKDATHVGWRRRTDKSFRRVRRIEEFAREVDNFMCPDGGNERRFLFRGVSCSHHQLIPSIARKLGVRGYEWLTVDVLHLIESASTNDFASQAKLLIDSRAHPTEQRGFGWSLEWWQIMQHYGGVTRLLDWTASPYVALYFAVVGSPADDGAVWMIDIAGLESVRDEQFVDVLRESGGIIPLIGSTQDARRAQWSGYIDLRPCSVPDERMIAQRGWYSFGAVPEIDHGNAIGEIAQANQGAGVWARKLLISRKSKPQLSRDLLAMNINSASLFPGLDGLARSVRDRLELMHPDGNRSFGFKNGLLVVE